MLAPRTGRKTRRDIIRFAGTAESTAGRTAQKLVATLADLAAKVEKKSSGLLHEGRVMTREACRELLTTMEKGQD